jgi:hypothetical protein
MVHKGPRWLLVSMILKIKNICPLSLEMLLRFSFAAIFLGGFVEDPSSKETV